MTNIVVSGLSIYPVKSCREVKQHSAWLEDFGLKMIDAGWLLMKTV